jgi:hypothetical protein
MRYFLIFYILIYNQYTVLSQSNLCLKRLSSDYNSKLDSIGRIGDSLCIEKVVRPRYSVGTFFDQVFKPENYSKQMKNHNFDICSGSFIIMNYELDSYCNYKEVQIIQIARDSSIKYTYYTKSCGNQIWLDDSKKINNTEELIKKIRQYHEQVPNRIGGKCYYQNSIMFLENGRIIDLLPFYRTEAVDLLYLPKLFD